MWREIAVIVGFLPTILAGACRQAKCDDGTALRDRVCVPVCGEGTTWADGKCIAASPGPAGEQELAPAEKQRKEEWARRAREIAAEVDALLAEIEANQKAQDKVLEELRAAKGVAARKAAKARYAELRGEGEAAKQRLAETKRLLASCAGYYDPLCTVFGLGSCSGYYDPECGLK